MKKIVIAIYNCWYNFLKDDLNLIGPISSLFQLLFCCHFDVFIYSFIYIFVIIFSPFKMVRKLFQYFFKDQTLSNTSDDTMEQAKMPFSSNRSSFQKNSYWNIFSRLRCSKNVALNVRCCCSCLIEAETEVKAVFGFKR